MRLPVFIARQVIRHRTASVNEYSGRYSLVPDRFWVPDLGAIAEQAYGVLRKGGKAVVVEDAWGEPVDPQKLEDALKEVGMEYKGTTRIRHFTRMLYEDIGVEKIRSHVVRPFRGVRLAADYGCHYVKPAAVFGNDRPNRWGLELTYKVIGF